MKRRDFEKVLERNGFRYKSTRGGHKKYVRESDGAMIPVPTHANGRSTIDPAVVANMVRHHGIDLYVQ